MTEVISELKARRRHTPFEPFVIVLKDGRRLVVPEKFRYAFTEDQVVVIDERDLSNFFKPSDIASFESAQPVA